MYYVVGLGKTGLSFLKRFPNSLAWDDQNHSSYEGDLTPPQNVPWHQIKALILSPGIPHLYPKAHPAAVMAAAHHVPVWCDVEVFLRTYPHLHPIGITGTNGKSTTTALIHHVLQKENLSPLMGGNIGIPLFDLLPQKNQQLCVIELSSYQLERLPSWGKTPSIGVLTNITPDHLNRHGGMEGYIRAKEHILKAPRVFMGIDSSPSYDLYKKYKDHHPGLTPVSIEKSLQNGLYVNQGLTYEHGKQTIDLKCVVRLPGLHNAQNMALCYAVARSLGIPPAAILKAFMTFPGLAHRLEWVGEKNAVTFVNDSKATNPEAVSHALKAYKDIYWILGGQAKESMLDGLEVFYPKIRKAYVFGENAPEFYNILSPHIPTESFKTLDQIVKLAYRDANHSDGGVVLLSPACASWDQYSSFEARGDHFKALAQPIIEAF